MGVNVASGQITGTTTAMQYSLDSTNGTDGTWIDASAANTAVTFTEGSVYVRQKAVTTNNRLVATIAPAPLAITIGKTDIVAANDGTITGLTAGKTYEIHNGTEWADTTLAGTTITGLAAGNYKVREAASASTLVGAESNVVTIQNPAPLAITIDKTDVVNSNDGTITGLTAGKTYEIYNGTEWSDATLTGTTITGLAAGTYKVREKASADGLTPVGAESNTVTIS
ncbi:hypothetical protein CD798_15925 [Bacillaceae bacterium SAOS 7]|nr:hypothetical protein CD798_15925 [Bacillaceae bacterium SAOS 7]